MKKKKIRDEPKYELKREKEKFQKINLINISFIEIGNSLINVLVGHNI